MYEIGKMNETIVVEMVDILQRTCLYQGLSVLIEILGIGLWYFRKKLFFPIVMIFIMFYGYFSANDYYRDLDNNIPPSDEQRRFAWWCNQRQAFNSCNFKDFNPTTRGKRILTQPSLFGI